LEEIRYSAQKVKSLFTKGLFETALRLTQKNLQLSKEKELFLTYIELKNWEEKVLNLTLSDNLSVEELIKKENDKKDIFIKLQNYNQALDLRFLSYQYILSIRSKIAEPTLKILLQKKLKLFKPLGIRDNAEYLYAKGTFYFSNHKFLEAYKVFLELFMFVKQHDVLFIGQTNFIKENIYQNVLVSALPEKKLESELPFLFNTAYTQAKNNHDYLSTLRLELAHLIVNKKYVIALHLIQKNVTRLKDLHLLEPLIMGDLLFGLVVTYFWNKKWSLLLKQINAILIFNDVKIDMEIKTAIDFIELFALLENNNKRMAKRKIIFLEEFILTEKSNYKDSLFVLEFIKEKLFSTKKISSLERRKKSFPKKYSLKRFIDFENYVSNSTFF
ncbi:MAG: hypothetical protein IT239_02860, partial [Bacteroidia bacterium]|nr:hypothetical protein [Bacteroidia bacterium]